MGVNETMWPRGVKRTRQRVQVLEAMTGAGVPLTVPDLSALLERRGTPIPVSTIYRILDTFAEHGMAMKTQIEESGMAVYEPQCEGHRHYAVCVLCHRVIPMQNCPMESFLPRLTEEGFHVLGHRLQMYGYCAQCRD